MPEQKFVRPSRRHPPPTPSRLEPYVQMLPSLLQTVLNGAVLALVGYWLTGQFDQVLKDRQVTVASVQAMEKLLSALAVEQTEAERRKLARQLSMYGVDAIGPLVTLAFSKEIPISVPDEGLTLIAVSHKKEVCEALGNLKTIEPQFRSTAPQLSFLANRVNDLGCKRR